MSKAHTYSCPHKPICPSSATRFACGQRTRLEDGVKRGLIPRAAAESLLKKYGIPTMTPASKVIRVDLEQGPVQRKLV